MTVVLAGGGTGGHVYPMIAVADAIRNIAPAIGIVFVGTDRGLETRVVPERGYRLELMNVLPIRGSGVGGALRGVGRASRAILEAARLLRQISPSVVVSFGGYAAGPVSVAARMLSVPLALLEPNAVLGLANRLLAPWVQRAYVAFEGAEHAFSPAVVLRTGVPIRNGFTPMDYRGVPGQMRLLVLGGSQGARALNQVVPEALALLGAPVDVVHQCGAKWEDDVRARYGSRAGNVRARVVTFIDDVPQALGEADLVIARSGASAVSEICAIGRPSVLVPYPYASYDHQRLNALALERAGAAVCIDSRDATADGLSRLIQTLSSAPGRLLRMARAARALGRPAAATMLAKDVLALASSRPSRPATASIVPSLVQHRGGAPGPERRILVAREVA